MDAAIFDKTDDWDVAMDEMADVADAPPDDTGAAVAA